MWNITEVKPDTDNTHVRVLVEFTPEIPGAISVEWDGSFPNEDKDGKVFTKPLTPTLLEKIVRYKINETVEEFKEAGVLPSDYRIAPIPSGLLVKLEDDYFKIWKNLNRKIDWEDRGSTLDTSFSYKE